MPMNINGNEARRLIVNRSAVLANSPRLDDARRAHLIGQAGGETGSRRRSMATAKP
jgi:hypothetical protein